MIERCQDTQGMAACCVVLMLWLIGANTSIIPSVERTDETSHSILTRLKGWSRFRNWSFFYSRNSTTLAHRLCQVLQLGLNCKGMFPQCFLAGGIRFKNRFQSTSLSFLWKIHGVVHFCHSGKTEVMPIPRWPGEARIEMKLIRI